jgi:glycosyltransferase involved in cell wall biosynthesis
MKILFLTSRFPYPPNRGDVLRTFKFLKEMSIKHEVHLVSLINNVQENDNIKYLNKYCKSVTTIKISKLKSIFNVLLSLINGESAQVAYYKSKYAKKIIHKIVQDNKFDAVYTHLIRMAQYSKDIQSKLIIDYTDAISEEYKLSIPFRKNLINKLFFILESKKTRKYEVKIAKNFNQCWFITNQDIEALGFKSDTRFKEVPNSTYIPSTERSYDQKRKLVFLGNLSVPHNISAVEVVCEKIMPTLLKKYPNLEFHVAGAGAGKAINQYNNRNNTKIVGFVDSLEDFMYSADAMLSPLFYSAGVQNKILEAMAYATPVICTSKVANAINASNGSNILYSDNIDELIAYTESLLESNNMREKIGLAAKKHIINNYSERRLSNIIDNLI